MGMNAGNYPRDIRITKIEQVTLQVDRPEIGTNSRAEEMDLSRTQLEMG